MTVFLSSLLLSVPLAGAYAIFGLGIVVIFQASRVLNLAHGGMAMISAYLYYSLTRAGIPSFIALILGLIAGGLLGWLVERLFVRPLRRVSETAQTVGTVAALGLFIALASRIWGTSGLKAPGVLPEGGLTLGGSSISFGELGLFAIMLIVSGALFAFLKFTEFGLAMRGAADNRRAASLMGIDPDLTTSIVWVLGGVSAALAGILLGAATSLHPTVLSLQAVPAFVAALIGGLTSLPGVLVGSLIVGVAQGLAPAFPLTRSLEGGPQVILALVAFAVMATRGKAIVASDVRGGVF
jgi:branched-chain amino acid transport system permease protein